MNRPGRLATLSCLLLLALAAAAGATSFVMVPDEALVDDAAVIAQATVESVEPAPIAGPPSTDYFVQIERLLKGYVTGSTIVVRVPGGIGPDGVGLRIWGVPEFSPGERTLLFLAPRKDGTYGVLHLMLGAFSEVGFGGARVAVRSLSEALDLPLAGAGDPPRASEPVRDQAGFVNWITDRAAGLARPIDYYLDPALVDLGSSARSGELLEDRCTQLNFRWSELDRNEAVKWSFDAAGLDGRGDGRGGFLRARRLWTRASDGAVRFQNGGSLRGRSALSGLDGVNLVVFDDPKEDVAGRFSCSSGGVLALTGIWFENGRGQACERIGAGRKTSHGGRRYLEILGADILVNDGAACLLSDDPLLTARVFAHELGHSLGLSHVADSGAVMSGEVSAASALESLDPSEVGTVSKLYGGPPGR